MAHISTISASIFTTLAYVEARPTQLTPLGFLDLFSVLLNTDADRMFVEIDGVRYDLRSILPDRGEVRHIGNVRELPSMGVPANITNVPVFGQAISAQVAAQPDAPNLEFTLNYVPTDHARLDELRRSGTALTFRVRLAPAMDSQDGGEDDRYDDFYFMGTVASLLVTPALNDAMQANITCTIDGDFYGPYSLSGPTRSDYGLPT